MEPTNHQQARSHLVDLMHEQVWISDQPTKLDADHAEALARLGFGFRGGRFAAEPS